MKKIWNYFGCNNMFVLALSTQEFRGFCSHESTEIIKKHPWWMLCLQFCSPCQVKPYVCYSRTPTFGATSLEGMRVKQISAGMCSKWILLNKNQAPNKTTKTYDLWEFLTNGGSVLISTQSLKWGKLYSICHWVPSAIVSTVMRKIFCLIRCTQDRQVY